MTDAAQVHRFNSRTLHDVDVGAGSVIVAAGVAAGLINAVVGSGTLITFPTLLALGYPPIQANMSNNVGLLGGGISAAWGYRAEIVPARSLLLHQLIPASAIGGAIGAIALLLAPERAFRSVVPALIAVAVVLVLLQPRISQRLGRVTPQPSMSSVPLWLAPCVALAGVYGGYFGAAQGVLLIALIGTALPNNLQLVNGMKNVLALVVNLVAAAVFVTMREQAIDWSVVALIALGSLTGGMLGARWGKRLPPWVLRSIVVSVGCLAVISLLGG